ncbi:267_t:CDS:2 [Ambispora gerdemannii]|uniref:267_t:CDS:1 n=1 Tax=Ambispora gerdemannii TaxID=144530 RepID=A0A9N9FK17_9GLOM|nr:267_t:CDS:2 [Ambispora gerdemannii]
MIGDAGDVDNVGNNISEFDVNGGGFRDDDGGGDNDDVNDDNIFLLLNVLDGADSQQLNYNSVSSNDDCNKDNELIKC